MSVARAAALPLSAAIFLCAAAASAEYAPQPGQSAFRARPTAVPVRDCERAVLSRVRTDKNTGNVQLMYDTVEEWKITEAKHGVRGDGQYLSNDHWKHFRFSCLHSHGGGATVEYRNVADVFSPAVVATHSPRGERSAYKRCESAIVERVASDKNTRNVTIHADGADEWDHAPGVIGVRGYGTYPSSNEINSFRFHCNYDARSGRVVAVDYHKTY